MGARVIVEILNQSDENNFGSPIEVKVNKFIPKKRNPYVKWHWYKDWELSLKISYDPE